MWKWTWELTPGGFVLLQRSWLPSNISGTLGCSFLSRWGLYFYRHVFVVSLISLSTLCTTFYTLINFPEGGLPIEVDGVVIFIVIFIFIDR
jgi:hypothetical protein